MVTMEGTRTIEVQRRHPLFNELAFVVKARAKEDTRPILTFIKVETKGDKQYIIAANGYQLHIADITGKLGVFDTGLTDGLYKVISAAQSRIILEPADYGGIYPNVWQLVPDNFPCLLQSLDRRGGSEHSTSAAYTRIVRAMGKGSFPFKQLKDIDPGNISHDWKFYFRDSTSPLVFRSENKQENLIAVIMPIYCE
jgi:hypothetical protein